MSVRTSILGLAAVAVVAGGLTVSSHAVLAKESPADDIVVATINGQKIFKKDVMVALDTLKVDKKEADKVFPLVIDQIIAEKLIEDETSKAKIKDDPEFKKRLDAYQSQLEKQLFVEKFLDGKVTDSAVKSEYEKFKKANEGKEEIHARHVLVATEEEAKQVIKDLDGGAKFADLAKQRSSDPGAQSGGDLGFFAKESMVPEFGEAAFKLKKGEYTKQPVKTQFGWHVILCEEKRALKLPSFKEVEMPIKQKLGKEALVQHVKDLRAKADIKLFDMNGKPAEEPKKN